jgi:hypothetical protein
MRFFVATIGTNACCNSWISNRIARVLFGKGMLEQLGQLAREWECTF